MQLYILYVCNIKNIIYNMLYKHTQLIQIIYTLRTCTILIKKN